MKKLEKAYVTENGARAEKTAFLEALRLISKFMYFNIGTLLVPPPTVYLYVPCGSQNEQRLFPHTALTDWFL